jgi:hypothetical protein
MSSARLWKMAVVVVVVVVFGVWATYAWFYFTRPAPLGLATASPCLQTLARGSLEVSLILLRQ